MVPLIEVIAPAAPGPSSMLLSGWLKSQRGMDLRLAITLLGFLFLFGLVIILFLPETKGQPLPE